MTEETKFIGLEYFYNLTNGRCVDSDGVYIEIGKTIAPYHHGNLIQNFLSARYIEDHLPNCYRISDKGKDEYEKLLSYKERAQERAEAEEKLTKLTLENGFLIAENLKFQNEHLQLSIIDLKKKVRFFWYGISLTVILGCISALIVQSQQKPQDKIVVLPKIQTATETIPTIKYIIIHDTVRIPAKPKK